MRVAALPQAKFIAPLLPEQDARLHLTLRDQELRFSDYTRRRSDRAGSHSGSRVGTAS